MRIACVLIPRFALALELLARPELLGRPVVLGGAPNERKLVLECSAQAERAGVQRGMPLRAALTRCRAAVFLEARPGVYADAFDRMLDALEQVSPVVQGTEPACAYAGLAGLPDAGTAHGDVSLAEGMQRAVQDAVGVTPSVGIADTRFAAWVAATSVPPHDGTRGPRRSRARPERRIRVVAPGEAAAFLASLPVEHLPVSDEMRRRLRWLGLRTAGELTVLSRSALAAQFGPEGALAWDLARGEGGDPPIPRRRPPAVSGAVDFPQPVSEIGAILAAVRHLLERLFRQPECAGRAVRGITISGALSNGHRWQRVVIFHEPIADRERLARVLAAKLDGVALPAPVETLALRLHDPCGESGVQGSLFAARDRYRGLDIALEQLRARFGRPFVMQIVGVEPWSRLPERQYALIDCDPSTFLSR